MLVASACCPKLIDYQTKTTIIREHKDTLINTLVVRPEFKITKDTTINKLDPCVDEPIVIYKKDDKGKLSMKVVIDSLGRITAECISKEDSLRGVIKVQLEKETVYKETVKTYKEQEAWWKKLIRTVVMVILGVVTLAGLLLYLLYKFKRSLLP